MSYLQRKCYIILSIFFSLYCSLAFATLPPTGTIKNVEGTLEIRLANYLDHQHQHKQNDVIQYALKVDEKNVYSLIFSDKAPANLKSGQRVKVLRGSVRVATDGQTEIVLTSKDIMIVRDISTKEIPDAFGQQKTLVMLVNFQDQANNKPWTVAEVQNTVFNTINSMFSEFSYQQTSVNGNVVGWYTVAMNSNASCNEVTNQLPYLAQAAAKQAGVDISLYNRYVYMFPGNSNCGWAGLGSLGGRPSNAWLNGVNDASITAHEIGHNLGLYHSHSLECQGSSNEGTCTRNEYGDYADTMGAPNAYAGPHFNAYQKERLGWLNFATSPQIQTITTSGVYTINAYETNNNDVKALKIVKRINASSKDYYYLELRQGIGFDQKLATCSDCDFTKGVLIHQANDIDGNSSERLDMSPLDGNKSRLVTLLPGKSFTDTNAPNGGVTINVLSVSGSTATVKVDIGTPSPCQRRARIQVWPGYVIVQRGEVGEFNFRVINTNPRSCPPSNFTFEVSKINDHIPATWTPTSASIPAGGNQLISLSAATSSATPVGQYSVRMNANNAADPATSGFTTGTLEVK